MNWNWIYRILVILLMIIVPIIGPATYEKVFPPEVQTIDAPLEKSSNERLFTDVLKDFKNNSDFTRISGLEIKEYSFLSKSSIDSGIYPGEKQHITFKLETMDHVETPTLMAFLVNPHGIINSEFSGKIGVDKNIEARFEIPEKKSCEAYGEWQLAIVLVDKDAEGSKQLIAMFSYPVEVKPIGVSTTWMDKFETTVPIIVAVFITLVYIILVSYYRKTTRSKGVVISRRIDDKPISKIKHTPLSVTIDDSQNLDAIDSDDPESVYLEAVYLESVGRELWKEGKEEEAIKSFKKSIEVKPTFAQSWFNLACAYSLKGDKENALKNLSKAIELDKGSKEDAKKDKDLKFLWKDKDFKDIVS